MLIVQVCVRVEPESVADFRLTTIVNAQSSSRTTLDVYQQSITKERRRAQAAVIEKLIGRGV